MLADTGFRDKRVAVLGDSMSWIGGDSCTNENGWTYHFKEMVRPYVIDVYARSGATWTNTVRTKRDSHSYSEVIHDDNVIYNQVIRLIDNVVDNPANKPDLLIIYAGANDAWFGRKRPGCLNRGVLTPDLSQPEKCVPSGFTTLEASIKLSLSLLRSRFPDVDIILVTPVEMAQTSRKNINDVSEIIESVSLEFDLPCLRADRDVDIRHDVEAAGHTYTTDGAHTNSAGARLIADYIVSNLNDIGS